MKVEVMTWIRLINLERFLTKRNLVPRFGESELRPGPSVGSPPHVLTRISSIAASWIRARFSYGPFRSLRIFGILYPAESRHTVICVPAFLHFTADERLRRYISLAPGGRRQPPKILFRSEHLETLARTIQHGSVRWGTHPKGITLTSSLCHYKRFLSHSTELLVNKKVSLPYPEAWGQRPKDARYSPVILDSV